MKISKNNGSINGSKNNQKIINTIGNNNKINSNNNNTIINNYYMTPFGNEQIDKLTTQDKLAILLSNEDPIIQIIVKTNLNSTMTEYHNIGYADLKSGYGYIFNGES